MNALQTFEQKVIQALEKIHEDLRLNWEDHNRFEVKAGVSQGGRANAQEFNNWGAKSYLKRSMIEKAPNLYSIFKTATGTYTTDNNTMRLSRAERYGTSWNLYNADTPVVAAIKNDGTNIIKVYVTDYQGNILDVITHQTSDQYVYPRVIITTETPTQDQQGWFAAPEDIYTGYYSYMKVMFMNEEEAWDFYTKRVPDLITDTSQLNLQTYGDAYGGTIDEQKLLIGTREHPAFYTDDLVNKLDYEKFINWDEVEYI